MSGPIGTLVGQEEVADTATVRVFGPGRPRCGFEPTVCRNVYEYEIACLSVVCGFSFKAYCSDKPSETWFFNIDGDDPLSL